MIGPSEIGKISAAAGIGRALYEECATRVSRCIAESGDELIIVPDRGIAVLAAQAYRKAGGRKILGLIPKAGTDLQNAINECQRNRDLCDEVIDDVTWFEQHSKLCEMSDAMVCIGLSCGTMCEIAWTKWTKKIPIIVFRSLITDMPREIVSETRTVFVNDLEEMKRVLKSTKAVNRLPFAVP